MFEYLEKFSKIVITGSQRSGTTVAAKMIAHDLGYVYVDEGELKIPFIFPDKVVEEDYSIDKLKLLCNSGSQFVVQAPALCRWIHEIGDRQDTAIIFMKRDLDEIIKSQERIAWTVTEEEKELKRYGKGPGGGPIAKVKWDFWVDHQRWRILNHFEVEYTSLAGHLLWVPSHRRTNWKPKQTAESVE